MLPKNSSKSKTVRTPAAKKPTAKKRPAKKKQMWGSDPQMPGSRIPL